MLEISIQGRAQNADDWLALARRCEAAGFRALTAADHPGASASPFVALAAAAAVTERIRLGTNVVNAGVREAIHIASDAATLDVVSGGRAELGIGAGHTPLEWAQIGRERPDGPERVARFLAVTAAVRDLLAGETVAGARVGARADLRLDAPRPVQRPVPLLVAGTSATLLRWGGAHADAIGLAGLGVTLADGHSHTTPWSAEQVDRHLAFVAEGAAEAGRARPALEALVQHVELSGDPAARTAYAAELEIAPEALDEVPYALIGSPDEVIAKMRAAGERWGIHRWVIRADYLDEAELLLRLSRETETDADSTISGA